MTSAARPPPRGTCPAARRPSPSRHPPWAAWIRLMAPHPRAGGRPRRSTATGMRAIVSMRIRLGMAGLRPARGRTMLQPPPCVRNSSLSQIMRCWRSFVSGITCLRSGAMGVFEGRRRATVLPLRDLTVLHCTSRKVGWVQWPHITTCQSLRRVAALCVNAFLLSETSPRHSGIRTKLICVRSFGEGIWRSMKAAQVRQRNPQHLRPGEYLRRSSRHSLETLA